MILITKKVEAAALALHLSVMRADYRNLLKRQYKSKKDDYLKSYDYVRKECEMQLEQDLEYKEQHLNIIDLNVLHAFLHAYIDRLQKALKDAEKVAGIEFKEDDEQVFILANIKKRCSALLADVS